MRRIIPGLRFEAVADAPPPAAGGSDLGGEPAAEAAPAPEATPAAAPDYGAMLSSPEGQDALQRAVYEAMQGYNPAEFGGGPEYDDQQQQQPFDPFQGLDPLDDDFGSQLGRGLVELLEQRDQMLMQQLTGMPAFQAAETQYQTQWADGEFGEIEKQLGSPVKDELRELSITLAAGSRPLDPRARFDPSQALRTAHGSLHTLIQREREAAVREYQEGLSGGGAAGALEPSANGTGAVRTEAVPSNMREAREAWERRNGLR